MDFSKIKAFNCDCIIPLGAACRPAQALRRNGLRFCSLPFDWMMNYTLESVLMHLKTKGRNFFISIVPEYVKSGKYYVQDSSTQMISMHDFPVNIPINKYYKIFHGIYAKRFRIMHKILRKSKKICFISNRDTDIGDIKHFVQEFKKLYKFDNLYYINVRNAETENIKEDNNNKITIYDVAFNDINKGGGILM